MSLNEDTIAAIGTAPGDAGISIVRISGPSALAIADGIFRCSGPVPSARSGGTFIHGYTHDPGGGDIDEVLLLIMRAPHSYTREDMVEIQGHGGEMPARRNLRLALDAGARLAEPGEFTRRAFLNGRLDLLQAEAVLDLIRARSDRAATAAVEQLEGTLSRKFNEIYDDLVAVAADLEATLDFPEDELPASTMGEITTRLIEVQSRFHQLVETWDEGRVLREGARVVIAGRPNVGKSTMLNALLGMERAIVSRLPGTTRDSIEEGYVLDGIPLRLVDTAGLRSTADEVENEGIRRTRRHMETADVYMYMVDASQTFSEEDRLNLAELDPKRCILVLNKCDLERRITPSPLPDLATAETSLVGGHGLDELRRLLASVLRSQVSMAVEPRAVISERHREVLCRAADAVTEAVEMLVQKREEVVALAVARLREGLECLGSATGRHYHAELLSSIFSRFCIGK